MEQKSNKTSKVVGVVLKALYGIALSIVGFAILFIVGTFILMCESNHHVDEPINDRYTCSLPNEGISRIIGPDDISVPPIIKDYKFDADYITVKQWYCKDCQYDAEYKNKGYTSVDTTYYWIIIMENDSLLGPLFYDDFIKKANQLEVSKNLLW